MSDDKDFHFPRRPVKIIIDESRLTDEDEAGDAEGGSGEPSLEPSWANLPEPGSWLYNPERGIIYHKAKNKKIELKKLNSASKIIQLLAVLEKEKGLDVDGLIIALQEASFDCYQKSLSTILSETMDGEPIEWKSTSKNSKDNHLNF